MRQEETVLSHCDEALLLVCMVICISSLVKIWRSCRQKYRLCVPCIVFISSARDDRNLKRCDDCPIH